MREVIADDFSYIFRVANGPNEAICITTNGMIKTNGHAVMGKGIAKAADDYFKISSKLGEYLKKYGNRAFDMGFFSAYGQVPHHVLTFPTKHDWRNDSDINLIRTSAEQIVRICNARNINFCYLPEPGCTNGHLNYETQVKPILESILDNRFVVVRTQK